MSDTPTALGSFPRTRLRRNRRDAWSRAMVRENLLTPADLIWPVFITEGRGKRVPIKSMPGVARLSVDELVKDAKRAAKLGVPAIALFPQTPPGLKTPDGDEGWNPDNLVCRAVRALKKSVPGIGVMCDVALDPYTDHGHDGLLRDGYVVNDETVAALVKQTMVQAEAGCDIIAPSDMMDGRIGAIREALDDARLRACPHHELRGEIRLGLLWPVPRRDRLGARSATTASAPTRWTPSNGDEALREVASTSRRAPTW
jgi:porphobilinogen synthase